MAHAALVAAVVLGAVVHSVEGAETGLVAHLVAAVEVGSVVYLVEAAELQKAVATAAQASKKATCPLFTLAVRTPGCMELAETVRAVANYWACKKYLEALDKLPDQHLAHEVVMVVLAANWAMVPLGAVGLVVAALD